MSDRSVPVIELRRQLIARAEAAASPPGRIAYFGLCLKGRQRAEVVLSPADAGVGSRLLPAAFLLRTESLRSQEVPASTNCA